MASDINHLNRIVYVSNFVNQDDFEWIFRMSKGRLQQQNQRYHSKFINSISKYYEVYVLPILPVNNKIINKKIMKLKKQNLMNVHYQNYLLINIPFVKQLFDVVQLFFYFFKYRNNSTFIVDSMCYTGCLIISLLKKFSNSKYICINTDLPLKYFDSSNKGIFLSNIDSFLYKSIRTYDAFINITSNIEKELHSNKPVLIINGFFDYDINETKERYKTHKPFSFAYAGAISYANGINNLIEVFKVLPNYELHLFGVIVDSTLLLNLPKNIHYEGNIYNQDLRKYMQSIDALVNPRPSKLEYTLYSFPSKTFEYIAFEKPIISTKLPCYSDGLTDHFYIFDESSIESMVHSIDAVAKKSEDELNINILKMIDYALREYSINTNGKKIHHFIENL